MPGLLRVLVTSFSLARASWGIHRATPTETLDASSFSVTKSDRNCAHEVLVRAYALSQGELSGNRQGRGVGFAARNAAVFSKAVSPAESRDVCYETRVAK